MVIPDVSAEQQGQRRKIFLVGPGGVVGDVGGGEIRIESTNEHRRQNAVGRSGACEDDVDECA